MGPPGTHFVRRPHHGAHHGSSHFPTSEAMPGSRSSFRSVSPDHHDVRGSFGAKAVLEEETSLTGAAVAGRRKRVSTENTAEKEGEDSSNDESISSVLVEEAHMGEDDAEDAPQDATAVKEGEGLGTQDLAPASKNEAQDGDSTEKSGETKVQIMTRIMMIFF